MTDLWDYAEDDHPKRHEYSMPDLHAVTSWALCLRPRWIEASTPYEEIVDAKHRTTRYALRRVLPDTHPHLWEVIDHPALEERETLMDRLVRERIEEREEESENSERQLALGEIEEASP